MRKLPTASRYVQAFDTLKAGATQTLPTLQHHLDMAQNIYKNTLQQAG